MQETEMETHKPSLSFPASLSLSPEFRRKQVRTANWSHFTYSFWNAIKFAIISPTLLDCSYLIQASLQLSSFISRIHILQLQSSPACVTMSVIRGCRIWATEQCLRSNVRVSLMWAILISSHSDFSRTVLHSPTLPPVVAAPSLSAGTLNKCYFSPAGAAVSWSVSHETPSP